jgi:hypothetical protein
MSNACTMPADSLERLARRRAGMRMGWYVHAMVYVAVNTFLALLSGLSGHSWAIFPAVGWGIGLAIHGFVVYMVLGGGGLHERLLERERRRLAPQRDAW